MQAARVAGVDQEPDHHGLAPLAREESDLLFLAFVEDAEVLLVEIADEAALFVRYRDGDNDFVDLHLNRRALALWRRNRNRILMRDRRRCLSAQRKSEQGIQ